MQSTYERILKYLIENEIGIVIYHLDYRKSEIFIRHDHKQAKYIAYTKELSNNHRFEQIMIKLMKLIFPSFKGFDTPIKI